MVCPVDGGQILRSINEPNDELKRKIEALAESSAVSDA